MYYEKIIKLAHEIESKQKVLNSILSELDKQQEDILHAIECGKYDAVQGATMLKMLKKIRKDRREVKNALKEINAVMLKVKSGNLLKLEPTKKDTYYILKSNILSGIIGKNKDDKIDLR